MQLFKVCLFFCFLKACWGCQYFHVVGELRRVDELSTDGCLARSSVYSWRLLVVVLVEDKAVSETPPHIHDFSSVYSPLENSWLCSHWSNYTCLHIWVVDTKPELLWGELPLDLCVLARTARVTHLSPITYLRDLICSCPKILLLLILFLLTYFAFYSIVSSFPLNFVSYRRYYSAALFYFFLWFLLLVSHVFNRHLDHRMSTYKNTRVTKVCLFSLSTGTSLNKPLFSRNLAPLCVPTHQAVICFNCSTVWTK